MQRRRNALILAIYAPNVTNGGGLTHLVALLDAYRAAWPDGLCEIHVFVRESVATRLPVDPRIRIVARSCYRSGAMAMMAGIFARFDPRLCACDLVLNVGPAFCFSDRPVVAMCRNMLPFEWREIRRFSPTMIAKLVVLRVAHSVIYSTSTGVIFLSQYAKQIIERGGTMISGRPTCIVPHGIGSEFVRVGRERTDEVGRPSDRLRLLYISIINFHKHQIPVMEAVAKLRRHGLDLDIEFVGPAYPPALRRFENARTRLDPHGEYLHYRGVAPHAALAEYLRNADIFVFASSCENFPNILVEGMAAGLPIACSRLGPMPEIARDAATYFDPDDPESIAKALQALAGDPEMRQRLARRALELSAEFSWCRTAAATWGFLRDFAQASSVNQATAT